MPEFEHNPEFEKEARKEELGQITQKLWNWVEKQKQEKEEEKERK